MHDSIRACALASLAQLSLWRGVKEGAPGKKKCPRKRTDHNQKSGGTRETPLYINIHAYVTYITVRVREYLPTVHYRYIRVVTE